MALNVGELYAQIKLDLTQFKKDINNAKKLLQGIGQQKGQKVQLQVDTKALAKAIENSIKAIAKNVAKELKIVESQVKASNQKLVNDGKTSNAKSLDDHRKTNQKELSDHKTTNSQKLSNTQANNRQQVQNTRTSGVEKEQIYRRETIAFRAELASRLAQLRSSLRTEEQLQRQLARATEQARRASLRIQEQDVRQSVARQRQELQQLSSITSTGRAIGISGQDMGQFISQTFSVTTVIDAIRATFTALLTGFTSAAAAMGAFSAYGVQYNADLEMSFESLRYLVTDTTDKMTESFTEVSEEYYKMQGLTQEVASQKAKVDLDSKGIITAQELTQELYNQLRELSIQSPTLVFQDVMQGTARLRNAGLEAGKLVRTVKAIGDGAAVTGKDAIKNFDRATYAIGQMYQKGGIYAEEFRKQLGNTGIATFSALEAQTGLSSETLAALMDKGLLKNKTTLKELSSATGLTVKELGDKLGVLEATGTSTVNWVDLYIEGLERVRGGAMDELADTFTGQINIISEAFKFFAADVSKPLFGSLKAEIEETTQYIKNAFDGDLTTKATQAFEILAVLVRKISDFWIPPLVQLIKDFFGYLDSNGNNIMFTLGEKIKYVGANLYDWGKIAIVIVKDLWNLFTGLISLFVNVTQLILGVGGALHWIKEALNPFSSEVGSITNAVEALVEAFLILVGVITTLKVVLFGAQLLFFLKNLGFGATAVGIMNSSLAQQSVAAAAANLQVAMLNKTLLENKLLQMTAAQSMAGNQMNVFHDSIDRYDEKLAGELTDAARERFERLKEAAENAAQDAADKFNAAGQEIRDIQEDLMPKADAEVARLQEELNTATQAGTAATQANTGATAANTGATTANTGATTANTGATTGNAGATTADTTATNVNTGATVGNTTATNVQTTAINVQTTAWGRASMAVKGFFVSLGPIGWISIAIGAITTVLLPLITNFVDLGESGEEAGEKILTKWEQVQQRIQEVRERVEAGYVGSVVDVNIKTKVSDIDFTKLPQYNSDGTIQGPDMVVRVIKIEEVAGAIDKDAETAAQSQLAQVKKDIAKWEKVKADKERIIGSQKGDQFRAKQELANAEKILKQKRELKKKLEEDPIKTKREETEKINRRTVLGYVKPADLKSTKTDPKKALDEAVAVKELFEANLISLKDYNEILQQIFYMSDKGQTGMTTIVQELVAGTRKGKAAQDKFKNIMFPKLKPGYVLNENMGMVLQEMKKAGQLTQKQFDEALKLAMYGANEWVINEKLSNTGVNKANRLVFQGKVKEWKPNAFTSKSKTGTKPYGGSPQTDKEITNTEVDTDKDTDKDKGLTEYEKRKRAAEHDEKMKKSAETIYNAWNYAYAAYKTGETDDDDLANYRESREKMLEFSNKIKERETDKIEDEQKKQEKIIKDSYDKKREALRRYYDDLENDEKMSSLLIQREYYKNATSARGLVKLSEINRKIREQNRAEDKEMKERSLDDTEDLKLDELEEGKDKKISAINATTQTIGSAIAAFSTKIKQYTTDFKNLGIRLAEEFNAGFTSVEFQFNPIIPSASIGQSASKTASAASYDLGNPMSRLLASGGTINNIGSVVTIHNATFGDKLDATTFGQEVWRAGQKNTTATTGGRF